MEWVDKHKLISLIVLIFIILGSNALFWKLFAITRIEYRDEKIYNKTINYTNKMNDSSLKRIENKLDTLIDASKSDTLTNGNN